MGYDISVVYRNRKETRESFDGTKYEVPLEVMLNQKHGIHGGTYCVGGTEEATMGITYNYAKWFYEIWPEPEEKVEKDDTTPFGQMFAKREGGIRSLYGKPIDEVIDELQRGIDTLKGEPDEDYWKATEGNARSALFKLKLLCEMARFENPCEDLTIEGD